MQRMKNAAPLHTHAAAITCALLVAACTPAPSNTSHSAVFSVTLDGGAPSESGLTWDCTYSTGFSERDMKTYVDAKALPNDAGLAVVPFADARVAVIYPSDWPPLAQDGRCTLPPEMGWTGFVIDNRAPIKTLTRFGHLAQAPGTPVVRVSEVREGVVPAQALQRKGEIKQWLSQASSVMVHYFELPTLESVKSTQLSAQVVAALLALPKDKPTLLQATTAGERAQFPLRKNDPAEFTELPDFRWANAHPQDSLSLPLQSTQQAITIPRQFFLGQNTASYMLDLAAPPRVVFPTLKEPVALTPQAAVWYPSTKQLIVAVWSDASDEVLGLLPAANP